MDTLRTPEQRTEDATARRTEPFEPTHRARVGRAFLARNLWWGQRLAEFRRGGASTPTERSSDGAASAA
jgi:hypothetical protein